VNSRTLHRLTARIVLVVAVTAVGVGGCAGLPTTGAVRQGITATPTDVGYPQFVPQGPAVGADPLAIVQGFLLATQAGTSEGFAAARRYLTAAAAVAWEPLRVVNLYSDARPPDPVAPLESETDGDAVEDHVPFDLVGAVDRAGRYAPSPATATSQSFMVTKDAEGMWRISVAPIGILLSLGEFVTQFRATTVYFVDTAGRTLLPDVRWFSRASAADDMVAAFLAGPPSWMGSIARNPVPAGITAQVTSAMAGTASTEVMAVTLSGDAAGVQPIDKVRVAAALAASLTDLPGVGGVEVRCHGETWSVPPMSGPSVVERDDASTAYAIERTEAEGDRLVTSDGTRTEPAEGFDEATIDLLETLTVAGDGEALAGLDAERRVVLVHRDKEPGTVVTDDSGGVAPVFDATGRLWFGTGTEGGAGTSADGAGQEGVTGAGAAGIASLSRRGAVTAVTVEWLAGEGLLALAPAPDAVRLLVISEEDTGAVRVRLAAVERDPWGEPVALGRPVLIATLAGAPAGVTWVDQLTIALLAPEAGTQAPQMLVAGGLTTAWRAPSGAGALVGIAAGGATADLLVVTEMGDLFARIGARWQPRLTGIRLATYPA
jgi:hypothetical protein